MNVRITAGFLKRRVIRLPDTAFHFRPTLERTRIAVADMVQPRLGGAVCADLCAGSGAFGFEMISRGAARVDFVEKEARYAESIRQYAERFGVLERCRVFGQEVAGFIDSGKGPYRVVFFDPPYDDPAFPELLVPLLRLLDERGILLYQRPTRPGKRGIAVAGVPEPFDVRHYGNTVVESYRVEQGF